MKAKAIKRFGKLSNVFLQCWAMKPIRQISVDFFNAMAKQKRFQNSLTAELSADHNVNKIQWTLWIVMNIDEWFLYVIIKGAHFVCFLGYNPFRIWMKLCFSDTYMLQSFGNDAGFILEISIISNRWDKNASVIYSGSGLAKLPQTVIQ